jgi:arylsulfate sulfotransferase
MHELRGRYRPLGLALILTVAHTAAATGTCSACAPCTQLVDQAIATTELFSACETLTAGPSFDVVAGGQVTLLSGDRVALEEGARVDALGELALDAGPHILPPQLTAGPTLTLPANAMAPLAGLVELTTDVPSLLRLDFDGGGDSWTADLGGPATDHAVPALGFRPDTAHTVTATVTGANELSQTSAPLPAVTAALPADFPTFTVTSTPASMEPGVTMFDVSAGGSGYLVIVDEVGDIVWFWSNGLRVGDARRLANGNLLLMNTLSTRTTAHEVDMLGNIVETWHANAHTGDAGSGSTIVDTDSFHHEIFEQPSGNFLVLSSEVRTYTGYPTSETDLTPRTDPADVVGDVIVEFQRDGTILNEWSLFDILDQYRIGYDAEVGGFWDSFYNPPYPDPKDWSHGNAVLPDPSDDTLIVSTRHQDAVFKFDRSGVVQWILAPPENWDPPLDAKLLTPVGTPFDYTYHQHAPVFTASGNLLLFDNHNWGASPPDPFGLTVSRAVEFAIDEDEMEVSQVWEYGSGGELGFCVALGDADFMPTTGNVLMNCGRIFPPVEGEASASIVEVTRTTPAVEVFELLVEDDNAAGPPNRTIYRIERLPALYP